ncbi:uncharacterized protein LOC128166354 [Crassostrea angulata]|uniref:uncharacterized protein LOC128166354 n=1 Tax=Magallana angulata TaxID=2784310 RepID=UPI0022B0B7F2|nr:uncharacterized protein LOC128166354 [Crassostrea angulata]
MKHPTFVIFIYFSIITRCLNSLSPPINFTNLMMHQLTMCGPAGFCNTFSGNLDLNISKSHKLCPDCFCDNLCFGRGDCCPDKYFAQSGLVCNNVTFVNATRDESRDQRSSFLMIKECPHETERVIAEKCEQSNDSLSKLKYPPVTSSITNLTYANRFCAQCNNETSYQSWNIDIYCQEFLDINFLSSFKEIVDNGIKNRCVMQFASLKNKNVFGCYYLQYHFDSCNKTGFWKTGDTDVLHACESLYVNNDTLFKNSFCRMCNPTFYKGDVISQCNVTGRWNLFDKKIKDACSHFELNEGTLPFKNIFCRICNTPETLENTFMDASAEISTKVLYNSYNTTVYYLSIKMNKFLKEHFNFVKSTIPKFKHKLKRKSFSYLNINITDLIYKSLSLKKYVRVCQSFGIPRRFFYLFLPCTCEPSCFQHGDCCEDFALKYPTKCIHSKQLSGDKFKKSIPDVEYLVTNGCYMQLWYPMYMEKLCQQGGNSILSSHPVYDVNTGISYLNMICYLCNKSPSRRNFELVKPWDIEVYCEQFIEYRNFLTVKQLLKTISETRCNVTYLPRSFTDGNNVHHTVLCNKRYVRYTESCNSTGKWLVKDPGIQYACENVSAGALMRFYPESDKLRCHKNHFCALCNPEITNESDTISTCKDAGNFSLVDRRDVSGCQFFPQINFYSPYKNLFCKHCNHQFDPRPNCDYLVHKVPEKFFPKSQEFFPIYRNLFMYSEYDDKLPQKDSPECTSTQAYISKVNQCRNLTCYPGKYLRNGTCQALFTVTKNLGYFLTSDFQGYVSSLLPVHDLLVIISEEIKRAILSTHQIDSDSIEYLFVQIDQPCFKRNQILYSPQFSGSIAVGIFIKHAVKRVDIEMLLIAFTTKMAISGNGTFNLHLSLKMRMNQLPYNPFKIFLSQYFSRCTLPEFPKYQIEQNRQKYKTVRISKLLTCVQVPLEFGEYHLDNQSRKLLVIGKNKLFSYDLFEILPNGSARICIEDFNVGNDTGASSSDEQNQDAILSEITLILNVTSIMCLLISFLIYVFKKDLRTIPGKINMILILSLILTLTVFQLSKFGSSQKVACVGIGIALHYFWLVSFLTMTVTSFHMYRIFQFSNINTSAGSNDIFRVYIAFITLLPCVVVVLNIIISWQVSDNGIIGYGNRMCFIDNTYLRLASFIIPVGIMCLSSLFFFVRTIISIKRVPNVPGNQSVRNEFGIFCRLFTITGITWVLQIIDGFLPFTTFSYISSIINSLQGTAIFIAFFLNKRIINCKLTVPKDSYNTTPPKRESTEESTTNDTRL